MCRGFIKIRYNLCMSLQTVIIGGGASALMLASLLPKKSALIVESNRKIGAKIAISGGGKCNITNAKMDKAYYVGDSEFVSLVLEAFNQEDLLRWLKKRGLEPVVRKESQYFCKESAKELLYIFAKEVQKQKLHVDEKVLSVTKKEDPFYVKTTRETYRALQVVVASGGLSFPKLGASGIGYEIAEHFGHSVTKTAPALVGFTVQKEQFFFKTLSGTSTEVEIGVGEHLCKGALLFTHKGISGPAVLDASLYWERGQIEIDFLPQFAWQSLRKSQKLVSSLLPLPKRVTKAFLLELGVEDKPCCQLTAKEHTKLLKLHHYQFAPAGTFGYNKAEVTKGGVKCDEIDVATMMSKRVDGLYFIGEVLDVTGRLGGYNFQWAFSSAFVCSQHLGGKRR